jgi:hypothetical protein
MGDPRNSLLPLLLPLLLLLLDLFSLPILLRRRPLHFLHRPFLSLSTLFHQLIIIPQ